MKNITGKNFSFNFVFLLLSLFFQSLSIYLGKMASIQIKDFSIISITSNIPYIGSLACLVLQAFVWQLALRKYPLYFAYLFMSGIYTITLIMSFFLFHEKITSGNIAGTIIITAGICIMLTGQKEKTDA